MCHPYVFPSVEYWLAGIQVKGEKSKQKEHTQNFKKCYNHHKKHKVLDSKNIMKRTLLNFSFFILSLSGCEPCHYGWLAAVCKFPPHLGLRSKLQVSREGECCYSRDWLSALHMHCLKLTETSFFPVTTWPPGCLLKVTRNTLDTSFRSPQVFFASRPKHTIHWKSCYLFFTFKMNDIISGHKNA